MQALDCCRIKLLLAAASAYNAVNQVVCNAFHVNDRLLIKHANLFSNALWAALSSPETPYNSPVNPKG